MRFIVQLATFAALAAPVAAQTTKRTPEQIEAAFTAHKGEFDYLLGDWEFTALSNTEPALRGNSRSARSQAFIQTALPA